jgi:type I restriction enzyme S subunit
MRPSEDLLNEWLYYFLSQESFRQEGAQRMGGAVGHKRLQKNFVEKSPIPLPPLPEQHRIVALLDEAFAQLTLAEAHAAQNLQNARALFESHLHQTFSHPGSDWVEKKLGEVCEYDKVQGIHKNLPYVGLEHIESNTAKFIGSHEPYAVKSMTFRFSTNHVLYGRLRPYLNKALSPNFDGHCSTEIFPLKPGKGLSREYLLYWLLCDSTCEQINATCTGTRMPRAQMNKVLGFFFPLPPLPEQRRIVAQLDALSAEVRKLEELYTRKQTLLAELKRSLLHHAFTGNL